MSPVHGSFKAAILNWKYMQSGRNKRKYPYSIIIRDEALNLKMDMKMCCLLRGAVIDE
jgi:hypothetical protein